MSGESAGGFVVDGIFYQKPWESWSRRPMIQLIEDAEVDGARAAARMRPASSEWEGRPL